MNSLKYIVVPTAIPSVKTCNRELAKILRNLAEKYKNCVPGNYAFVRGDTLSLSVKQIGPISFGPFGHDKHYCKKLRAEGGTLIPVLEPAYVGDSSRFINIATSKKELARLIDCTVVVGPYITNSITMSTPGKTQTFYTAVSE